MRAAMCRRRDAYVGPGRPTLEDGHADLLMKLNTPAWAPAYGPTKNTRERMLAGVNCRWLRG